MNVTDEPREAEALQPLIGFRRACLRLKVSVFAARHT